MMEIDNFAKMQKEHIEFHKKVQKEMEKDKIEMEKMEKEFKKMKRENNKFLERFGL